ncbi:MAG: VOC family protein [Acidimicrobiales bacterium]
MFEINAITFVTRGMAESVQFWTTAGLDVAFGGPDSSFTSLRFGDNFVNLTVDERDWSGFWGRVVFHVPSPDELWRTFADAGYRSETAPADAPWGERYFHILDPDGHELSFARRLSP